MIKTTLLHYHGGQWCVEWVYRGEIVNTSYVLEEQREDDVYFRECSSIREIAGQSSALIPPYDPFYLART